ncbi:SAM-dependent methyltransferase [Streptomyces sp. CB03238]|uniref:SAM-dependent methyltransferase n=1 Tax=Streptomyces sp. CB03238 TaxID=1907777 RepID=UPI000A1214E2|nr:SAM-dependent methyltransferase [Streptomyces sp. CB03238]ORT56182.1 hypothetical protein BKD26_28845 [Streptomyces sp. CB03238]
MRIRTDIAHDARVWNYWLGGKDDYPVDRAAGDRAMESWNKNTTPPITARSRAEFASFLDGLEVLEPGIVSCASWRFAAVTEVAQFGAVARKP